MNRISVDNLLPGDIVMHRGSGQVSKFIGWLGQSDYSHVAMYTGRTDAKGRPDPGGDHRLVEARQVGVSYTPLSSRLHQVDTGDIDFVDVFRCRLGSADSFAEVLERARRFVESDTQYAFDQLYTVFAVALVQRGLVDDLDKRLPPELASYSWLLKLLVNAALYAWVETTEDKVGCSEFVYRCFACADTPVEPRLEWSTEGHTEWPADLTLSCLAREMCDLKEPPALCENPLVRFAIDQNCPDGNRRHAGSAAAQAPMPDEEMTAEVERQRAGLRRVIETAASGAAGGANADMAGCRPVHKPESITPRHFETSPDIQAIGRLAGRGQGATASS